MSARQAAKGDAEVVTVTDRLKQFSSRHAYSVICKHVDFHPHVPGCSLSTSAPHLLRRWEVRHVIDKGRDVAALVQASKALHTLAVYLGQHKHIVRSWNSIRWVG